METWAGEFGSRWLRKSVPDGFCFFSDKEEVRGFSE